MLSASTGRKTMSATTRLLTDADATGSGGYGAQGDIDPLLLQLPPELKEFVRAPEDHSSHLAFVERSPPYDLLHTCLAVLCCPYSIGRMHVVKQGEIGLTQFGDSPELLKPGRHALLAPWNQMVAIHRQTQQVIINGPIHIIKVRRGELGYAIDMTDGHPMLLSQGKHIIKSDTLKWKGFINLRRPRTELDQLEVVRVETGNVGYAYKSGELVILEPGLHLISPPNRFGGLLSTQIAILDLPGDNYETSDYVTVTVRASLFYRIVEPKKALLRIQNVTKQLMETSVATLAGIIRSSSLSDVASRSQAFYHDPKAGHKDASGEAVDSKSQAAATGLGVASAPPFYQHVHDEFINTLADHVLDEWGVQIQNIRIESLMIADAKLQADISSQAVEVTKQHNRYLMLQKQQEILTVEANTRAAQKRIDTMATTATTREIAKADADAIVISAEANKQALTLRGEGEAEYSRLLEATELGRRLAAMKVQAKALSGLNQVAYVPHLPGMLQPGTGVFAVSESTVMPSMK